MKRILVLLIWVLGIVLSISASADTPVVTLFSAPSNLESGQPANLSWTINGGGHSLILFCAQGVKLYYTATNQPFSCDTRISISKFASDGVSLIVANVSGSPRMITARIIPKDGNYVDYDAGAVDTTIYVKPSRQPVTAFYSNSTSTVSGAPTTLSWSSSYLDGVNLKIDCNDSITATSTVFGNSPLPCGQSIFQSDLQANSSIAIQFYNQSPAEIPLNVTLLPAMSPGVYDGTHSQTITLTVASDAQKPLAVKFGTSRKSVYSGDSVLFDWNVTNGPGANIKFSCSPFLEMRTFTLATTTTLPCGDYGWPAPLPAVSSTSVTFINSGQNDAVTVASFFPLFKNGTYSGTDSRTVTITVSPVTNGGIRARVAASAGQNVSDTPAATAKQTKPPALKNVFKSWLSLGFRGEDVKTLQRFLAKDKSIYPEKLVTGTFGPATKRAVGRFQLRYGIVKSAAEPAYGALDVKTRALLNSLQ